MTAWRAAAALIVVMLVSAAHHGDGAAAAQSSGAAVFVRDLQNPRDRRETRADILDTPVNPGSTVKAVALVAALESGVITPGSSQICRRQVTVDGRTFVCAHPDLKRPLSPAEALAYSCNDFFVSLARRLSRESLNTTRLAAGLPPIGASTPMAPAIVGLEGPRTTPRALIDMMARLVGVGPDRAVAMRAETKAVLLEGLKGAAEYGTASTLKARGVSALAKTGTVTMPGGAALGLVVALSPADKPTRGAVVVAPGGAGADAATIAADLLSSSTIAAPRIGPPSLANRSQASSGEVSPKRPPAASADTLGTNPSGTPGTQGTLATSIRLGRTLADGRTRVESIALDDYIAQVLAGEGQPSAADAAQQALAITARTFALANRNRHRREGFDLCDSTHCQVVRPSTPVTRRAADATSGRVLLYEGQPAFVFYSAWCGGRSELASQVWPGAVDYPYEPALEDDACRDEDPWTSEIRAGDIERALRDAGLRGSRLLDLHVLARNASKRVARIRVEGFTPSEMSGHEFRMAIGRVLGWQLLKSTAFDVERTGTGYRFRGRGFGHGVGLCVLGAGNRASRGASAEDILRVYYPGLQIGPIPSSAATTTATTSGAAASRPAATVPAPKTAAPPVPSVTPPVPVPPPGLTDVALALPAGEEGERGSLVALVRKSRDEVAALTGVTPPSRLRVTVHPSVDSFGRATGQPWWVSGATDGTSIETLPIAVLRRQGQLDRTIRHEVAHALLDSRLSDRPMWVREGAALYYSNATPPKAKPSRVKCPSDQELLRAVSAGAQREAYARAETCFARAIADGKRWSEVR
jgi:SpoIID/LytB domain protein